MTTSFEDICKFLDLETDQAKQALKITLDNIKVMDKKNKDYGRGNIEAFGEFGCLVRANDKIERLKNLLQRNKEPSNESIEDSWLDLSSYAIIAVICRRGLW